MIELAEPQGEPVFSEPSVPIALEHRSENDPPIEEMAEAGLGGLEVPEEQHNINAERAQEGFPQEQAAQAPPAAEELVNPSINPRAQQQPALLNRLKNPDSPPSIPLKRMEMENNGLRKDTSFSLQKKTENEASHKPQMSSSLLMSKQGFQRGENSFLRDQSHSAALFSQDTHSHGFEAGAKGPGTTETSSVKFSSNTLIFNGKGNWIEIRSTFYLMLQNLLSQKTQTFSYGLIPPHHFVLDPKGNITVLHSEQNVNEHLLSFYTAPEGSGSKAAAFTLGLILLQMCTGKRPDDLSDYSSKTYRQEILEGRLSLPSHIPEDLRHLLLGLLNPNPQERLDAQLALKMLNLLQNPRSASTMVIPIPNPKVALNAPLQRSSSAPIQAIAPVPQGLLLSNNQIAGKPLNNSDEEEENQDKGDSIQAVILNWDMIKIADNYAILVNFLCHLFQCSASELEMIRQRRSLNKSDENFWNHLAQERGIQLPDHWQQSVLNILKTNLGSDSEIVALIHALKTNKIRVGLLSHNKDSSLELIRDFALYSSSELSFFSIENLEKPNPKAYETLSEEIEAPLKEILFINDQSGSIKTAKQMGMNAVLCVSIKEIREELFKRNLIS